jgi:hypothetical protein
MQTDLTRQQVVLLVHALQPAVMAIRLNDPDGPVENYPEIVLFQKMLTLYNAPGWAPADFVTTG